MASLGQQTIFLHAQHKASDRALLYRVHFEGLHVLAGFCRSWLSAMTSLTFTQEAHELRVVAAPSGGVPSRLGRWINGRSFTRNGRCNKGGQCPGQHRCGQLRPLSQKASAFADRPNMALQPAIKRSSFEDPFPGVENWPICLQGSGVAFQCFLVLRLEMQHSRSQARHFAQQILRRSWNKLTSSRRPSIALPKAEPEKFRGPWTTARCFVEFVVSSC